MLRILDQSVFRFFGRWTQFVFLLASFIAVIVTLVSFSGFGPIRPASASMIGLQIVNFILIGALAFYVIRDFYALSKQSETSTRAQGSGKLARQFAMSFGFAAVMPAILVALFLGTSLNRGIENWFSERIQSIVETSADVARSNLQSIADDIRLDVGIMGLDLNAAVVGFETEPEIFTEFLVQQASFREFPGAFLLNETGDIVLATDAQSRRSFQPPRADMFATAQAGDVAVRLDNSTSQFWALYKLQAFDETYLYTARPIAPQMLESLVQAEQTVSDYRLAEDRSRRLQVIFLLGFIQITVLILLFFLRFGVRSAAEISSPILRLADAADDVRRGYLKAQVPMPTSDNEVADLTASFNAMTEQLLEQRDTIDLAHRDAIERSRFIETVLEGVSAGVVRTDENLRVTLANRSAKGMFPQLGSDGEVCLFEVLPEFAQLAEDALEDNSRREKTIVIDEGGSQTHFVLRISPEAGEEPGCIITFDDNTRLINAQRQTAWRDVARRIAHEIRNPLTPIQLSTERLKRRYRKLIDEDDTVFDKCTDTILRQVTDIGRMVEEFSSFARMPKPEVREFDLMEIVRSSIFGNRLTLPEINISLNSDLRNVEMAGDDRLLGQVLTNLIKNAGEAVRRRFEDVETIEDDKPEIIVSVEATSDTVTVEIEDSGPGFPRENRSQFLEPYFTTREQGVGLGLAIVNRIVLDHGGHLTLLDRKDGKCGARVAVQLPISGPSEETVSSWALSEERV